MTDKDDDLTLHFTAMDWKPGPPPEQKEPRKRRKVPEELLNLDIT